jgi:hypothetical protein
VPLFHNAQRDFRRATHHCQKEGFLDGLSPAAEDFSARTAIEVFGIEHQAVEIEDDRP